MIQKFAVVPRVVPVWILTLTILAGAAMVHAQQTADPQSSPPSSAQQTGSQQTQDQPPASSQQPAAQQPASQPSGEQEPAEEESIHRKVKPKEYKNWSFNVGGGGNLTLGTTRSFARGGGGVAAAGAARNFNKYFGLRLDFQWDNLPLRSTALELGQATGGNSHVYTFAFEPVINIPATKEWGGYLLGGPAYFHRTGRLDNSSAIPGSTCDTFFQWWGRCYNSILPLNGNFLSESVNQPGYDVGAGVTRKITPNVELYVEFRQMHGSHNGITTDFRPITLGVRW